MLDDVALANKKLAVSFARDHGLRLFDHGDFVGLRGFSGSQFVHGSRVDVHQDAGAFVIAL
jgi:hypothetical protein